MINIVRVGQSELITRSTAAIPTPPMERHTKRERNRKDCKTENTKLDF